MSSSASIHPRLHISTDLVDTNITIDNDINNNLVMNILHTDLV